MRKFVDGAMGPDGQGFLERSTVDKECRARYDSSLRSFLVFAEEEKLPLDTSADWDEALVVFMNRRFFEGHQACDVRGLGQMRF